MTNPTELALSDAARYFGLNRNRMQRFFDEYKTQLRLNTITTEQVPGLQEAIDLCGISDCSTSEAVARSINEIRSEEQERHERRWAKYQLFKRHYEDGPHKLSSVWFILSAHLQVEHQMEDDRFLILARRAAENTRSGRDLDELRRYAIAESIFFKQQHTDCTAEDFVANLNSDNAIAISTLRTFSDLFARSLTGLLSKTSYLFTPLDRHHISAFGNDGDDSGITEYWAWAETLHGQVSDSITAATLPLSSGLEDLHYLKGIHTGRRSEMTTEQREILRAATHFDDLTDQTLDTRSPEAEAFLTTLPSWHAVHQLIVPTFTTPDAGSVAELLTSITEFGQAVISWRTGTDAPFRTAPEPLTVSAPDHQVQTPTIAERVEDLTVPGHVQEVTAPDIGSASTVPTTERPELFTLTAQPTEETAHAETPVPSETTASAPDELAITEPLPAETAAGPASSWMTYDSSVEASEDGAFAASLPEDHVHPVTPPSQWWKDHVAQTQVTDVPSPEVSSVVSEVHENSVVLPDPQAEAPHFQVDSLPERETGIPEQLSADPSHDTHAAGDTLTSVPVTHADASPTPHLVAGGIDSGEHDVHLTITPQADAPHQVSEPAKPVTPQMISPFELEHELAPLTVAEINTTVQELHSGTRVILNEIGDPSAITDPNEKRSNYNRLFKLYREYHLLASEENLPHLGQTEMEAYHRLGVRFRENLAELKP